MAFKYTILFQPIIKQVDKKIRLTTSSYAGYNLYHTIVSALNNSIEVCISLNPHMLFRKTVICYSFPEYKVMCNI